MLAPYIYDMDVCSMYAWGPLTIKQSLIVKLLKIVASGKSHRAKIQAKRRLKWYKNAYIEFDTEEKKDYTKKRISRLKASWLNSPFVNMEISFDYDLFRSMEMKKLLNEKFGSLT